MKTNPATPQIHRRINCNPSLLSQIWLRLSVGAKRLAWRTVMRGRNSSKRAFDIAASATLLLILSPLYLLIAAMIKLEDRGPALFVQRRVGKHGIPFNMYKFRSMCLDAEDRLREVMDQNQHKQGITFKFKDDPRITRAGRWLRKFSFDELPQIYNVLRGDMSLVGPRPSLPREVELYTPGDRRRLQVTPGITCLWQISGRANIDFSGQVALDVEYIEHQNLWGDVKILAQTVPAVLAGTGAY